ncbi:MAG: undecaprenyl-phosphate glucose phosphotransferase [Sulfuritalea sp.]|nr:undecaprenyl-phosphate glucose phosphotransferase [Sulfuritalea sp.]MBK8120900.1 undecaprenyl-phosphate glucose phosphotransferase [Sulfuritalea sp.]
MPSATAQIRIRRAASLKVGRDNLVNIAESLIDPLVFVLALWGVAIYTEGELTPPYLVLSVIMFSLTFPAPSRLALPLWRMIRNIVAGWIIMAGLLVFFGYASRYIKLFDDEAITLLLWLAPVCQVGAHLLFRASLPYFKTFQGGVKTAVIAGMNDQGVALARRVTDSPYATARVAGFFDDRAADRLVNPGAIPLLGKLNDLPRYANEHRIDLIYLSLPMVTQSRILHLLENLRDTTASIYFVPDTFVTDLVQGRIDFVEDIPVVAVCETPFSGVNRLVKRASDMVFSLLILTAIAPLLLCIAAAVKLSSPGPVIFKQRRYGLNGEEIMVYKFRSMTVCEDGENIPQARRDDARITAVGAFLRRTSLDELPQFFNVLQGHMSIVGPRPHAVSHNELYRKLIRGYMVRHKVKPGITGWAQVNGFRGETDTVEKMQSRIDCDLEYLRHWSLRLDVFIILKTVLVIFKDEHAY